MLYSMPASSFPNEASGLENRHKPEGCCYSWGLENTIFTTKRVFTFQEACMYIGVSESMLYKLTSSKEIPHYKPRGKMVYFAKEELDEWLLQNYEPTVNEAVRMATEAAATEPFLNKRRNGKRKKD